MTCQTDDLEREKAYLHFVEDIQPKAKPRFFALDGKFLGSPARRQLSPDRYFVLIRRRENNVSLFRQENVELEKDAAKLEQRSQKIAAARTVLYDGQERTLQQMAQYQENVNRDLRLETWSLSEQRRLKDREVMDQIYDELISLRQRIAKNAGFDNYRDYAFRRRERFDYSPQDCFQFHQSVERYIVPLVRKIQEERQKRLGVDVLRPWDILVDPEGRPALRPFRTSAELMEKCRQVYDRLDSDFEKDFCRLVELNLIDPDSRAGKAPGGYCVELSEVRLPFIFLNLVGRDDDVRTILHESGHGFHAFATRDRDLPFEYRGENVPTEFAEVASMSMELLGGEQLDGTFYNHEDAVRSRQKHLEEIARLLPWIATIDAFQHWIYTNPNHTHEQREEFWLKLRERFAGLESWENYDDVQRSFWQRQGHLFTAPFYYIEYGIAQLGALGIWTHYLKDPQDAVQAYKRALALGGSKPLPQLFKAADLPFNFGSDIVQTYAHQLRSGLSA
jgi:oligoendopeptidase F